ncbi:MAG: hypothetical protein ACMUIL_13125 [bacterium]
MESLGTPLADRQQFLPPPSVSGMGGTAPQDNAAVTASISPGTLHFSKSNSDGRAKSRQTCHSGEGRSPEVTEKNGFLVKHVMKAYGKIDLLGFYQF